MLLDLVFSTALLLNDLRGQRKLRASSVYRLYSPVTIKMLKYLHNFLRRDSTANERKKYPTRIQRWMRPEPSPPASFSTSGRVTML